MSRFFKTGLLSVLIILICIVKSAQAELVVIVNAASNVEHLSHEEVVNVFMGRYRKLSDGGSLQPLDIKGEASERRDFYQKLLDKSLAEINAYWARLVFSGRTSPPIALDSQREVLEKVAQDSGLVGYIEKNNLSGQVKVVYTLTE